MKNEIGRKFIRIGEGIKASIKGIENEFNIRAEATNLSPWKITFFILPTKETKQLKNNLKVKIQFSTLDKHIFHTHGVISKIQEINKNDHEGIECSIDIINYLPEDREKTFYTFNDFFSLHAWCNDPLFFGEKILFKIIGFHPNGLELATSARNKSFLPNLIIKLNMTIPLHVDHEIKVQIKGTNLMMNNEKKDRYIVYCTFLSKNDFFLSQMIEYLLFSGLGVSLQELKSKKLPIHSIKNSMHINYATSPSELNEVYEFREKHLLILKNKNDAQNSTALQIKQPDKFDSEAIQIMFKIGRTKFASIRLIFSQKDQTKSEISDYVESLPDWLWMRKFVEISKFACNNEYFENDVFINIIKHIIKITVQTGYVYIITIAPPVFEPLYTKIGFQSLTIKWKKDVDSEIQNYTLMLLDTKSLLKGEYLIEKCVWDQVYGPVAEFIDRTK